MATFRVKRLPNGRLKLEVERRDGTKFESEHPGSRRRDLDDEIAGLKAELLASGESTVEYPIEPDDTPLP